MVNAGWVIVQPCSVFDQSERYAVSSRTRDLILVSFNDRVRSGTRKPRWPAAIAFQEPRNKYEIEPQEGRGAHARIRTEEIFLTKWSSDRGKFESILRARMSLGQDHLPNHWH
jgi:hypothetical protein